MSFELPEGLRFVDQAEIEFGNMERLFDDVVRNSDPDDYNDAEYVEEFNTKDSDRICMGVIDPEQDDRLVAYASATMRDGHATVDTLVVSPLERGHGIGMALATEGIGMLEKIGASAISFVVEHESVKSMIPKLVDEYGFVYDAVENEYIRRAKEDVPLFVPKDFILDNPNREHSSQQMEPIDKKERIAFKKRVCDLLTMAAEHTGQDISKSPVGFSFSDGRRSYYIEEFLDDSGNLEYLVFVSGEERVIKTSRGLQSIIGQTYRVIEPRDQDEPTEATCTKRQSELDDYVGYYQEDAFTKDRYSTIMNELGKLTVSDLGEVIDTDYEFSLSNQENQ